MRSRHAADGQMLRQPCRVLAGGNRDIKRSHR
jgi:hypothetical protein